MAVSDWRRKNSVLFTAGTLLIGLMMIAHWLYSLRMTDSFFSIYAIYAIVGAASLVSNLLSHRNPFFSNGWERIWGFLFSALFSLAAYLANYLLFFPEPNILKSLLILVEGMVMPSQVLIWILSRPVPSVSCHQVHQRTARMIFVVSFVSISLVDLVSLFFREYPGALTIDSIIQVGQIFTHTYTNHHPFWHTLMIKLCLDLGMLLFQDINKAVALFSILQILAMAGIFSFLLMTLYQRGVRRWVILLAFLAYLILPYHISYSVTMWKDVPFAGAVALFGCALYRELRGIGHRRTNDLTLILGAAGFGLLRSNGWVALLLTTFVSIFLFHGQFKRVRWILLSVVFTTFVLSNPVLKALHVEPTEVTEYLSIPLQQIARIIVDEKELTQEETEQIEAIFDFEEVRKVYMPQLADPIKALAQNTNVEHLEAHKLEYFKLWVNIGRRYPLTYLFAWVDATRGYWNSGYDYYILSRYVVDNPYGIEGSRPIPDCLLVEKAFDWWDETFMTNPVFEPLRSIGFAVWMIALTFTVSLIRKRKECVIGFSLLMLVATVLVSAPVFCEFRYVYSIFTSLPFVLPALAYSGRTKGEEEAGECCVFKGAGI